MEAVAANHPLITAQLLQTLVRLRRYHFDDFMDGDGPYWTAIGLFIDGESGTVSTLDRVMEFADESIETCRHITRALIERGNVQRYTTRDGEHAYRLSPDFAISFRRYLDQQSDYIRDVGGQLIRTH